MGTIIILTPKQHSPERNVQYTSENVIYLITCKNVMHNMLDRHTKGSKRMNSHRFDIYHYPDNFTNVSVHLNENGHTPSYFSFAPIDKVDAEWQRLLKETYWMHRLNTIYPNGMNSKVLYQISNILLIWCEYVHNLCIHMLFVAIYFLANYFYL